MNKPERDPTESDLPSEPTLEPKPKVPLSTNPTDFASPQADSLQTESPQVETREEALIEALMPAIFPTCDSIRDQERRVESVMRAIEKTSQLERKVVRTRQFEKGRLVSLAVVASLLIGVFVVWQFLLQPSMALATVNRSLEAAQDLAIRQYALNITHLAEGDRTVTVANQLYVQGNQRFALKHPGFLPGSFLWLGKNEKETWVVPALGPIRVGNDLELSRWLNAQVQLDTPYLHVSSLLKRMSSGYQLSTEPIELVPVAGTELTCQHVIGVRKNKNKKIPERIELWAETKSGIAVRIDVRWERSTDTFGRQSIEIKLLNFDEQVAEDWFEPYGHTGRQRTIIRFDTDNLSAEE